jgi:hypothetical protein
VPGRAGLCRRGLPAMCKLAETYARYEEPGVLGRLRARCHDRLS